MTNNPKEFYTAKVKENKEEAGRLKRITFWLGMLRLFIFIAAAVLTYLLRDNLAMSLSVAGSGLVLFLIAVSRNTDFKTRRHYHENMVAYCEREIRIIERNIEGLKTGEEYLSNDHHYNADIDLFGRGSIFQLINRTSTIEGEQELAQFLNENKTAGILKRQEGLKELSTKIPWVMNFQVTADLIKEKEESGSIPGRIKSYQTRLSGIGKYLPTAFSILSGVLLVLTIIGLVQSGLFIAWFFIGLAISGIYFRKITQLYMVAGKMTETFRQYSLLLNEIEDERFETDLLREKQGQIQRDGIKASQIVKQLSKDLNSLDQRNNILFAFVANGLLLWDLRYGYRIEKWIDENRNVVGKWFETIAFFDAFNSLAGYVFAHPNYSYPQVDLEKGDVIDAVNFGHPLLNPEKRISNDIQISNEEFFIITGANMAGKSTFLRTVALGIVMANVGLPVCAGSFKYRPVKLISSMRTTDSLMNDESYFFSELKRLKFIVDELENERYFIILDEILKGTNSKDKEEGSKKLISRLVGIQSTGIIATHDLSLCELSNEFTQVKNHYFDAEIVNNELYFDYKFKDGVCSNMNASFLLKKMEIV